MSIKQDIEKHLTENGGYTKKSLAVFGVSWPPPKGWKDLLIKKNETMSKFSKEELLDKLGVSKENYQKYPKTKSTVDYIFNGGDTHVVIGCLLNIASQDYEMHKKLMDTILNSKKPFFIKK